MLKALQRGHAQGVIIRKIDRSARNLKDWADLGELIDSGSEVHFANEALDLTSRGGRLSADIQAVVAADYIRNLREETKKGFYGRLKQGILPMPAPLGYLNIGSGKPKELDPQTAPLVRQLFELYSTATVNFAALLEHAARIGLRGRFGKPVSKNGLSILLNNPFYIGLIHVKKTNQTFSGIHEPLIPKALFDRVQDILHHRLNTRVLRHDFLFRRRLTCKLCRHTLIGEPHKNLIYYRCQIRACPNTMIREEAAEAAILERLTSLSLSPDEQHYFSNKLNAVMSDANRQQENVLTSLQLQLKQLENRLSRLTDAYVDRLIDRDSFEQRKTALLSERLEITESLAKWQSGNLNPAEELRGLLERADTAYLAYKQGTMLEKRELIDSLTSNRLLNGKTLEVSLNSPFDVIGSRLKMTYGSPRRDIHLVWQRLLQYLIEFSNTRHEELNNETSLPSVA
jgi:site-specific DNA recombinase